MRITIYLYILTYYNKHKSL